MFRWDAPQPLRRLGVNRKFQFMAWIYVNGERMILVETKALTSEDTWSFTRDQEGVTACFDGATVPEGTEIAVSFRRDGFHIHGQSNVELDGFTFLRQSGDAILITHATGCAVVDCAIIEPNMHGIKTGGSTGCRFVRDYVYRAHMWASNFMGQGFTIEECVFQTCTTRNDPAGEPWVGILKFNGGSYHTVRHNVIVDRYPLMSTVMGKPYETDARNSGIWGDIHCMDNRIYGNAVARVGHAGIYLEHMQNRNTVLYNTLQDCGLGVTIRQGQGNVVRQNWIFDTHMLWNKVVDTENLAGLASWRARDGKTPPYDHPYWGREVLDGICLWQTSLGLSTRHNIILDNLVQVSGRAISIPVPTVLDKRAIADVARVMCTTPDKVDTSSVGAIDYRNGARNSWYSPLNNVLDRNLYAIRPERLQAGFAFYADKQIDTFAAYTEATGFDEHSQLGAFGPGDIGLTACWTVPSQTRHPDLPIAIDYDGGAERGVPANPARWNRGIWLDADKPTPYSWYTAASRSPVESSPVKDDPRQWTDHPLCRGGIHALAVVGGEAEGSIPIGGLGWRTISVPVNPGTTMEVGLWLKAISVRPAQADVGVEVCAVFTDWTGSTVDTTFLVGNGKRTDLIRGDYEWTEVADSVAVSDGAARMFIYVGLQPAKGSIIVDDLRMSLPASALPRSR